MRLVDLTVNPMPPGGTLSAVMSGTVRLRVARWLPGGPAAGTVLVCPGRSEFIEKYAEVVADLLARAFAVVVIDWRGQGGSGRLLADPRKGHVRHFADYRRDLDATIEAVLRPGCPRPFFALAHSMGGPVVLDHAARASDPVFERIVLSAPMLAIAGLKAPRATRRLAAAVIRMGGGAAYVPGGSAKSWMARPFAGNPLTSDPARYAVFGALAAAAPDLLIGAPTFGWLHAAFTVMASLDDPAVLRRITTPVLTIACGADSVVETRATERVLGRLPAGRTITVPHALHEIMMEADPYRAQFWAAFDRFVPGAGGVAHAPASSRTAEQW